MATYLNGIVIKTSAAVSPLQQADWDQDLNATVSHSSYIQKAHGWVQKTGHEVMAELDAKGRVASRRYTFQVSLQQDTSAVQTIWVIAHEFGHKVTLYFPVLNPFAAGAAPGAILNVLTTLPTSISPVNDASAAVSVVVGAFAFAMGSCSIDPLGRIRIWAGPVGWPFLGGAGCTPGFQPFSITYDTCIID